MTTALDNAAKALYRLETQGSITNAICDRVFESNGPLEKMVVEKFRQKVRTVLRAILVETARGECINDDFVVTRRINQILGESS